MRRWNFDRYRNGNKMAEGISVHEDTLEAAIIAAKSLNDRYADTEEKLMFRDNKPCVSDCHRCELPLAQETDTCLYCGMTKPDPARQAQIDHRIYDMWQIHEIEINMTDFQRQEWIAYGRYILGRDAEAGEKGG